MIRALPFLILLTACAEFPIVDAATPAAVALRPEFLTPQQLASVNAQRAGPASAEQDGAALRARAAALRAK